MAIYHANAVRFLKQYKDPSLTQRYASLTATTEALRVLQTLEWTYINTEIVSVFPNHEEGTVAPDNLNYYDAYTFCAEHGNNKHRIYAGMAAYRITLPDAAVGLSMTQFSVSVSSDPYNPQGTRLAIMTSSDSVPSTDWTVQREGGLTAGTKNFLSGLAPRTTSTDGTLWYAATATANIIPSTWITLQKYLWVFLSLEKYDRARNGWAEGSSTLSPSFSISLTSTIPGYDDGANIGGGYDLDTLSKLTIVEDSPDAPYAPRNDVLPPAEEGLQSYTREITSKEFVIGSSPLKEMPPSSEILTAIPPLFAQVHEGGSVPVDVVSKPLETWKIGQLGISNSVVRKITGETAPFQQKLVFTSSSLAVLTSFQNSFVPTYVKFTNKSTDPVLIPKDCEVFMTVWWASGKNVSLQGLGTFLKGMNWYGEITSSDSTFINVGKKLIPSQLNPSTSFTIDFESKLEGTWGTFLFCAVISRFTASSLAVNDPIGLLGVDASEDVVRGTGWMPIILLGM